MRIRLLATALACGALALTHSAQAAAPPTLDGKKTKVLTATFSPAAQDNDKDIAQLGGDRAACQAPRCGKLIFTYKPAKGVSGDVAMKITWTTPGEDFDLYFAEVAKDGSTSELAHCGATAGTSEKLQVAGSDLKAGKTYALVVDYYRATGSDKVTGTVSFPGSNGTSPVPAAVDSIEPIGCGF